MYINTRALKIKIMKNKKLNYISLFSGIGTWEYALKALSYDINVLNFAEIHANKIKLYSKLHNIDTSKNLGDISKLTKNDFLKQKENYAKDGVDVVDLITYSFPCQDISLAGQRNGLIKQDGESQSLTRSGLFFKSWDMISTLRPKVAIFENVAALLHNNMKNQLHIIINTIINDNYEFKIIELSPEKIGVPMRRPRIFGIAINKDYFDDSVRIKGLTEEATQDDVSLQEWLCSDLKIDVPSAPSVIDYLKRIKEEFNSVKNSETLKGFAVKKGENSFASKYISINQAQTILFSQAPVQLVYDRKNDIIRFFNIEEISALFGVPNTYYTIGRENGYSDSQLMSYLGDAVSVDVLRYIFNRNKHLFNN